jgi:RNA polymerase sigma factor for flagellar operon FliA
MRRATAAYAEQATSESALISRYSPLVESVARRVSHRTGGAVSADELWSAGACGLLEALRRFDATRAVGFEAFAEHRIRGAMLDELRRMDHLPRRLRSDADGLKKAKAKLGQRLGREATNEELAAELKLGLDEVAELEALSAPPAGLSELMLDTLRDDLPSAEAELLQSELRARLAKAITALPERTALVLSLHFVEGFTYREIAGVLKVSEVRVFQIQKEAVIKLRALLEDDDAALEGGASP